MGLPQIKAYNQLNVDNGTKLLIKDKSVSKALKNVYMAGLETKRRTDNPLETQSPSKRYLNLLSRIMIYRRIEGITPQCIEVLIYIYNLYLDSYSGITVYGICKAFGKGNKSGNELINMRTKIKRLEKRGLLLNVGSSCGGSHLFIPTVKAINDLESLFKGV